MDSKIITYIEETLNEKIISGNRLAGGCIANNKKIQTSSGKTYFLKYGIDSNIFRCEANGLNELSRPKILRIPLVIDVENNFLLTEYIKSKPSAGNFFLEFGKSFAQFHLFTNEKFGFYEDNYIGANIQKNIPDREEKNNWTSFYYNKRLLYQYQLAEKNGYISFKLKKKFSLLEGVIENILKGSEEPPTLLHGDLWNENFLCDENNSPVLIDPAVYYGHREADLAMTHLFGGFDASFYEAYIDKYPLKDGWEYRQNIYKLYHVLNHLNLFGTGYLKEAEWLVDYYL